ncbi:molybdopterin molybdotransferase MoeA [Advenella alkanexedens]|uniref:Molybdopterin molybdenumtransferase n=1 Tax=Advenella alkanexedens TaxID=1481665 RepID=A0ABS6NPL7_9BURK|nr:gephyrin-like molybdotransferase Glp [Advenella alkanexedens]MBV4397572.1 molybdopterin molybdotransferase MoeA [Advenella alkanexedens]
MRDYYEALEELLSKTQTTHQTEDRSLEEAEGYILAEALTVNYDAPMFDNSAMDGYAVCDLNRTEWEIIGVVAAGDDVTATRLEPGQAVRIFTGAGIPANTDSVVPQENTTVTDSRVSVEQALKPSANIRRQGEELKKGDVLVSSHTVISPAAIGLLASQGYASVSCFKPLTLTLFSTGDELLSLTEPLAPGKIYDSNRPMLLGWLKHYAYLKVVNGGVLPDDYDTIKQALHQAAANADIIICSGGASVGDKDYVKQVLDELGTLEHWKLAIKPGKPFAWGNINNRCKVFLLPGNPVASYATTLLMTLPAIKYLAGLSIEKARPQKWKAQADFSIPNNKQGRRDFWRGALTMTDTGVWAAPVKGQGSHMLSGCVNADVLIEVPAHTNVEHGQWIDVYPLSHSF